MLACSLPAFRKESICYSGGFSHIPTDLVVKRQAFDIVEVISLPLWQRNIVQTSCRNRKWWCEPLSHRRSNSLPLIPVECEIFRKLLSMHDHCLYQNSWEVFLTLLPPRHE